MPGIGLMKKRLETEKQAVSLAMSGIVKNTMLLSQISKHLKQSMMMS